MAQTDRGTVATTGASPLPTDDKGTTRALVIGISDYVDDDIADLKYAHRDAQIFYDYLLAANGAFLPTENVRLLLNEKATLAAIDVELNWLLESTKKGDRVIIYFSGHGDVEKQTLWQRGYLLAHDTPYPNLRNNAVRVEELDEIVKTLSVGREARVTVILDACRAGKLAGTGPSLTAEQLEKQVENEVRILSCKPDQKSLEGENWGQGRGLFSFFLVNGLMGLADAGTFPDQMITLDELTGFVKNGMQQALSDPSFTSRQNPVFVGDENFEVAEVNDLLLAQVNGADMVAMTSPGMKGIVERGTDSVAIEATKDVPGAEADWLYEFADYSYFDDHVVDPAFPAILSLQQPDSLLNFLIQKIREQVLVDSLDENEQNALLQAANEAEHSKSQGQRLKLLLATKLHDQAQTAINDYLRGDPGSLDKRYYIDQAENYVMYPRMLQAALILLPEKHLLRHKATVKMYYFDGVCTRLASQMSPEPMYRIPEALSKQHRALALDDKAAYIHNELGLLHYALQDLDSAIFYFKNANDLAPNWALPKANLCSAYSKLGKLDKAKQAGEAAVTAQPDFYGGHLNLGWVAELQQDLLKAENLYRKARSLNDPHYLPYERRAYLQVETGRYEEAEWNFYEMELRKMGKVSDGIFKGVFMPPLPFSPIYFEYPSLSGPGVIHDKPKTAQEHFMTGKAYYEIQNFKAAEPNFKQAMRLDPNHLEVYYYLGDICQKQQRYEEAEVYFLRLLPLRPEVEFMPVFLAEVYQVWQRPIEEAQIYRGLIKKTKNSLILEYSFTNLYFLLDRQKRYSEAELLLWEAFYHDDEKVRYLGLDYLSSFYSSLAYLFPNDANWMYRMADFSYDHINHKKGVLAFEQVLDRDSNFVARPYIHSTAGAYYLHEGKRKYFRELNTDWAGDLPKALIHLRQAARIAPTLPTAKFDLALTCKELFEYDEALSTLVALQDSNDLNFDSRLLLADLLTRSGRFAEADVLLKKAWDIQPTAVLGLPGLSGRWEALNGDLKKAINYNLQEFDLAVAYVEKTKEKTTNVGGRREGQEVLYDPATSTAYTLARLYAKSGNKKEALNWLKKAFELGFDSELVVKYDPAFNELRTNPTFQEIIQP